MDARPKILIVEDDAAIRLVLDMILNGDGYTHVLSASRGDEGLEAIRRYKPDLVLLDIMLPGMGGLEVCREVRRNPALAEVRIILLTALAQSETSCAASTAARTTT